MSSASSEMPATMGLVKQRDHLFAETKRAQSIINGLSADRERLLAEAVSADEINLILSEDARTEGGELANAPYLAVKIAEAIEARIQKILKV